jgi:serine/threonine protein kinase
MPESDDKARRTDKTRPEAIKSPSDSFTTANDLNLMRSTMHCVSDRFEVLAEAGRGGMGVIYRARDRETDEVVALKTLRPGLAATLTRGALQA